VRVPLKPPPFNKILSEEEDDPRRLVEILTSGIQAAPGGHYLHWDELRHRPAPEGLTHRQWWLAVKFARAPLLRTIPLRDREARLFQYSMPDPILELVHKIDQDASGRIQISEQVTNPETRDRYIVSSLIEEAATSSQLEGAATTIQQAKEMIRMGRKPIDRSERMVLNNYLAMRKLQGLTDRPLSPDMVFELHHIVTSGTLPDPQGAGRLRRKDDPDDLVLVTDRTNGRVLHTPPDASELPDRLKAMCDFANDRSPDHFIHPVVRAIILHFWLAYDHPFVDGNGRTARALFYWSMLSQGYWLMAFVSISKILRKAPSTYARSFLYTETDDNDLTYFLHDQLQVIRRAIKELHEYLALKSAEIRTVEGLIRQSAELNHRQIALLSHSLRHPDARYTVESHRASHNVAYDTARTDLHTLAEAGLLRRRKAGKRYVFSPADSLSERLREMR
jgi:Fic family protein